ncbi:MAG: transposase [Verrucomicrobium sp.]
MSRFRFFNFDLEPDVSRRRLPHWQQPEVCYFITFRTSDSLPAEIAKTFREKRLLWLQCKGAIPSPQSQTPPHEKNPPANFWRDALQSLSPQEQQDFKREFSEEFHQLLDAGHGECLLRRHDLRAVLDDTLLHFDGDRYLLGDYVIMPNHVHALVQLAPKITLKDLGLSWKRFSARQINSTTGKHGPLWQGESYDRIVRDAAEFAHYQQYIADNPTKARLQPGEYSLYKSKWT